MRFNKVLYFIFLSIFSNTLVLGKNYYVSNLGNDKNDGTAINKPIKTIDRVNQLDLIAGDSILFKRGDTFFGELAIKNSGEKDAPIFYGAYGSGTSLPILTGAKKLKTNQPSGNKYVINTNDLEIKQVFLNGEIMTLARMPNKGIYRIEKDDPTLLYASKLSELKIDPVGARIKALTRNWQWEIRRVINYDGEKIKMDSVVWRSFRTGYGYYLEDKLAFLDADNEWFYSKEDNKLHLLTEVSSPTIEVTLLDNIITLSPEVSHVVIQEVNIQKGAQKGISLLGKNKDITIRNNQISDIEVFGIYGHYSCEKIDISNNKIRDIRGKGMEFIEPKNSIIKRNEVSKIGLIAGYGFDGVNNGSAIIISNREIRTKEDTTYATNNLIDSNRVDSTGYNGIRMDGRFSTCSNNLITNTVLNMNDGAAIYCWALPGNYEYTKGNTITNNIIQNVVSKNEASAGLHRISAGIYLDNRVNNVNVTGNKIFDVLTGIRVNDGSFEINVEDNFFYNNKEGVLLDVYMKDTVKRGDHTVIANKFYFKDAHHNAICIHDRVPHTYNPGHIDENIYFNPLGHILNESFQVLENKEILIRYKHEDWMADLGYGKNAVLNTPKEGVRTWELRDRTELLLNTSFDEILIKKGEWVDFEGNEVTEVELKPLEAKVLLRKNE